METETVKILKKENNLEDCSKEELIRRIKSLEAHNVQLKRIIAKSGENESQQRPNQKPFDFSKCHFRHVFIKFYYLGWDYNGFAVQEDTTETIENYLFKALIKTCLIKDRSTSNYHRCGRTDKGVSSFGQVISLDIRSKLTKETENNLQDELDYCQILNSVLPENIQCVGWSPVNDDFSARFNCKSRMYKYFFPRGQLNVEKMREASRFLLGTHDFRNLCKMDVGNGVVQFTRNIEFIAIEPENFSHDNEYSMYVITIKGKAFLWHQIRCIMGVLILIGQNREDVNVIKELLDVDQNPRKPEYHMASEIPLNLYYCDYNDVNWTYNSSNLVNVIKRLKKCWIFHGIKECMIRHMISSLQSILKTMPQEESDEICLSEYLMQGIRYKKYIPLMKRQKCESLEEKIKHFAKRKRIEVIKENNS
ncbi:tRNA pseudouridine(38/39) synthase [Aethina tumida]|uniref:tRNA pseudouridine(38/39) synthase n=1 Tax=Aethina tumida TaxID=116153 RepID=UPI00096B02E7|nr:tRNA pseudouridine(38/39) synthase [Aethina tumida]